MTAAATHQDGLAKFLAGDADTFFAHQTGVRISALLATGLSTSTPQSSNYKPTPVQHPVRAQVAKLRFRLDGPAADDRIRSPGGTSRTLLAGFAFSLAVFVALCAASVVVLQITHLPPAAITPQIATEEDRGTGRIDPLYPTAAAVDAPTAPPRPTAVLVDEATAPAAIGRWHAESAGIYPVPNNASGGRAGLQSAAPRKMVPQPITQLVPHRPPSHRRLVSSRRSAAEFYDLLRKLSPPTLEVGCPPSLGAACGPR
jgi:hypothetical protein